MNTPKIDFSKLSQPAEVPGWFIRSENQNYGPYTRNQMKEFSASNRLGPESDVYHATSTKGKWVKAKRIRFLDNLRPVKPDGMSPPPFQAKKVDKPISETWSIHSGDGSVSGPYTLNDVLNFVALGSVKPDTLLMSSHRFNREWVAAFRVPEVASTLRQSMEFTPSRHEREHNKCGTNRTLAFISGGSFVLAGLIWLSTIIGFPIAIIAFFMAGFNIVSASIASDKSNHWCRARFQLIGILDIVVGILTLGNLISIICGIINLSSLPAVTTPKRQTAF